MKMEHQGILLYLLTACLMVHPEWPFAVGIVAHTVYLVVLEVLRSQNALKSEALTADIADIKRQLDTIKNVQSLKNGFGK